MGAGIKDMNRNIQAHQQLLLHFLISASRIIKPEGQIHVTLKSGLPYDLWDIREIAKNAKLFAKWTHPFIAAEYEGYEHRRTLGFEQGVSIGGNVEIVKKECKTYAFTLTQQNNKRKAKNDSDDE